MKAFVVFALLAFTVSGTARANDKALTPETSPAADAKTEQPPARHPLKGVVVSVLAEKSALVVKHEAIPGYMAAMTMLFKVDAATLAAAQKGQRITGTLVKKADGFWLENVQPGATAPTL